MSFTVWPGGHGNLGRGSVFFQLGFHNTGFFFFPLFFCTFFFSFAFPSPSLYSALLYPSPLPPSLSLLEYLGISFSRAFKSKGITYLPVDITLPCDIICLFSGLWMNVRAYRTLLHRKVICSNSPLSYLSGSLLSCWSWFQPVSCVTLSMILKPSMTDYKM